MRILLINFLFLLGCASNLDLSSDLGSVSDQWQFDGKIAIVYAQKDCQQEVCRTKSDQGQLSWQQNKSHYDVKISDPFGKVLYQFQGDDQSAVIVSGHEKRYISNPKQFLAEQLKIAIKPSTLTYWLTGRPDPNFSSQIKQSGFEQQGFLIKVVAWIDTPTGKFPKVIRINHQDNQLKIAIKQWNSI